MRYLMHLYLIDSNELPEYYISLTVSSTWTLRDNGLMIEPCPNRIWWLLLVTNDWINLACM